MRNLQFEVAEQVLRELEQATAAARHRLDYGDIWSRLLDEALQAYRQERADKPVLRVAPADRTLAAGRSQDFSAVEEDDAVPDGLELLSPDRRLRVRNTLRSRLGKGRERFLKDISDALQEHIRR